MLESFCEETGLLNIENADPKIISGGRLYTGGQKACGVQALPFLHVCHTTEIASLMCLLVSMNHP